jgi:hypothetical protein
MKGMTMNEAKLKMWEIFVRIIAISMVPLSMAVGYQFNTLAENDKQSMEDRNALRERIAVTETKTAYTFETLAEIRAALIRIEDRIERHAEQDMP